MKPVKIKVGDQVQKIKGFPFPGRVLAIFDNMAHVAHVVIECNAPMGAGMMLIFPLAQIEPGKKTR